MSDNVNNNLGALPEDIKLTGQMVTLNVDGGRTIELDSGIAARLKSIEIIHQVTRADGTVEDPVSMKTEFDRSD